MAFVSAKSAIFSVGGTDISAYTNSIGGASNNVEMLETTSFGATAKAFITGLKGGEKISLSGHYDLTLHTAMAALVGAAAFACIYGPAGSTATYPKFTFNALLESYELGASVAGLIEWTATLQVTAATTITTY